MKKIITAFLAAAALFSSVTCTVSAAGNRILKSTYTDGVLDVYVSLETPEMELLSVKSGDSETEAECSVPGDKDEIHTVFLVDGYAYSDNANAESYIKMIRGFLSDAYENETFSLMSFGGTKLNTETDFTGNQMQVLDAAENIKPSSEVPDLYSVLAASFRTEESEPDVFERIIVFTGTETVNSIMFSDPDSIKDICPVYYIVSGKSADSLFTENLTDTGSFQDLYRYSPENSYESVPGLINDFSGIRHIKTEIPDDVSGNGGLVRIAMEFEGEGISAVLEETVDTGDRRLEKETGTVNTLRILIVVISMIAVVLAFLLVYFIRKNKVQTLSPVPVKSPEKDLPHYTTPLSKKKNALSTILSTVSTRVLFRESSHSRIILTEIGNPDNRLEISSEKEAVIGRNQSMSDYVIYNERSVSQKHCRVYSRNSKIYIEDLGSLNHTYVDGEEITGETELFTGSVLKIGRVVFDVKIVTI